MGQPHHVNHHGTRDRIKLTGGQGRTQTRMRGLKTPQQHQCDLYGSGIHGAAAPPALSWESVTEERHALDTTRRTWPQRQGHFLPWEVAQNQALLGTMDGEQAPAPSADDSCTDNPNSEPGLLARRQVSGRASRHLDSTQPMLSPWINLLLPFP